LRQAIAVQRAHPDPTAYWPDYRLPNLEFVYYVRWSLSCAPIVLSAFAIVVASRLTRRRTLRWFMSLAVVYVYWSLYYFGAERAPDYTLPMLMAWTPNILLSMLALAVKLAVPSPPTAVPPALS
jgi:lipopolysaccharide export LptBFGC system permease protein LptF